MYKKIKKIWSLMATSLLASLPFIGSANIAFATGDNKGTVNVHINYDDDIEPTEGDIFTLTYSLESDQNNTATINIDASMFADEDGTLTLPPNTYAILDITYGGSNLDIIEQGYGCNKTFYCSERTDGSFTIAIGDQKVQSLSNNYGYDVRIKDANHNQENGEAFREDLLEDYQQNGSNPYTQEEYDQDQEDKKNNVENNDRTDANESDSESLENIDSNNTQNNADNNEDDETYSDAPITNNGEAKVENYLDEKEDKKEDKKDNERKSYGLSKLLLIIIVAIIGFAIMFIMHAKGII